ncbi:hypothetical protein [Azospirillum argentinense]|uniref:hypothetical protein n=1 Tax=Azospirillum argentinense TaxID=2970906 RepID=UPI0010BFD116|nr:hypothetical protein [Azospirillum argentinense]
MDGNDLALRKLWKAGFTTDQINALVEFKASATEGDVGDIENMRIRLTDLENQVRTLQRELLQGRKRPAI